MIILRALLTVLGLLMLAGCAPDAAPATLEPISPAPAAPAPATTRAPVMPPEVSTTAVLRVPAVATPAPVAAPEPSGASALCTDGTYRFGRRHPSICARHGGVARWL